MAAGSGIGAAQRAEVLRRPVPASPAGVAGPAIAREELEVVQVELKPCRNLEGKGILLQTDEPDGQGPGLLSRSPASRKEQRIDHSLFHHGDTEDTKIRGARR